MSKIMAAYPPSAVLLRRTDDVSFTIGDPDRSGQFAELKVQGELTERAPPAD